MSKGLISEARQCAYNIKQAPQNTLAQ